MEETSDVLYEKTRKVQQEYSKKHGNLFKYLIVYNNYKTIIEIGVSTAVTTLYLCDGARENLGIVYGYDIWDVHGLDNQFEQHCTRDNCVEYLINNGFSNFELTQVNMYEENSKQLIREKHKNGVDFVFIDGCHSYKGIKNDFDCIYPLLSQNGTIAFHDTLRIDGCREFIIDLRTKYNDGTFDIIDFPFGNGERRTGVSLLVKRTYPILNIKIDEICGSESSPDEIYKKEKIWYEGELKKNAKL